MDSFLVLCESFLSNTQTLFNVKFKVPEKILAIAVAEKMLAPIWTNNMKDVTSTTADSMDDAMFLKNDL